MPTEIYAHARTHIHSYTHMCTHTQITPTCTHKWQRVLLEAPPRRDAQRSPGHREHGEPPRSQLLTRRSAAPPWASGQSPRAPPATLGPDRQSPGLPAGQLRGRPPAPAPWGRTPIRAHTRFSHRGLAAVSSSAAHARSHGGSCPARKPPRKEKSVKAKLNSCPPAAVPQSPARCQDETATSWVQASSLLQGPRGVALGPG